MYREREGRPLNLTLELRAAIAAHAGARPSHELERLGQRISQGYRHAGVLGTDAGMDADEHALAYATSRMPATHAALLHVMNQTAARRPTWRPRSLLDVGAGPGTAGWAASEVWPSVESYLALERRAIMIELGKSLASSSSCAALRDAQWEQTDLAGSWATQPAEVGVASYVLGELSPDDRRKLVDKLWAVTTDTIIVVEPGTSRGFDVVREMRRRLLDMGAHTVAPCPHDNACPMSVGDWCHFAQRVSRSPLHRRSKQGTLAYEDEKFSYAAMSRFAGSGIDARVIRHPQNRPGHIRLELCAPPGLRSRVVSRSDKAAFRVARKLSWGSAIEVTPADPNEA